MSTVDLILLGFLYEQPQSAYDIQKQIKFRNLSHWIKIGKATIFKNVTTLERSGYLSSEITQEGKMPKKTIYSITDKGRVYFKELINNIASQPIPILFDFNTVIASINKIPVAEAILQIEKIRSEMLASYDFIKAMQPQREHIPLVGRAIIDQQLSVLKALLDWLDDFQVAFEKESSMEEM